jgi:hypothetical protein
MKYPVAASLLLVVGLAMAGCSSDYPILYGSSYPSYSPAVPRTAKADGPVPVAISGAPFAPSEIVAALNARPNMFQIQFAPDGKPGPNGYRIALTFDANVTNPCLAEQIGAYPWPSRQGTGHIVAAFCRYGGLLSRTTGEFPQPASSTDPKFQQFLSAVVNEILPFTEPDRIGGSGCGKPADKC